MTPLHLMSRQTFLGYLFLLLGVLAFLGALAPVAIGLLSHPRVHGDASISVLTIGFVVALFGAWLLPSSGAPAAGAQMVAVIGPYVPRIPGLSRVGDPPSAPPQTPPAPPPEEP